MREISENAFLLSGCPYSHPDGRTIVTSSADFSARVWIAQVEDLLELAERLTQREPPILTPEERQRFLGE